MLDAPAQQLIRPSLNVIGAKLAGYGIRANAVTIVGVFIGALVIPALAMEAYGAAIVIILVNRFLDGVDGAVARVEGITDLGGYLDIICDFFFYSAVPFGFALARPDEFAVASAFVIFSFIGTGTSFLAYAIIAEKQGIASTEKNKKSMFYVGGLTEGTETIIFLTIICVFPNNYTLLAYIFGIACWVTSGTRIFAAFRNFEK